MPASIYLHSLTIDSRLFVDADSKYKNQIFQAQYFFYSCLKNCGKSEKNHHIKNIMWVINVYIYNYSLLTQIKELIKDIYFQDNKNPL